MKSGRVASCELAGVTMNVTPPLLFPSAFTSTSTLPPTLRDKKQPAFDTTIDSSVYLHAPVESITDHP